MENICSILNQRQKVNSISNKRNIEKYLDWKTSKLSVNNTKYLSGQTSKMIFFIEFSPDGNMFASSHGHDHSIKLFDSYTKKLLQSLHGHPRTPWTGAFHPRINFLLASGCLGGEVRLWNFQSCCRGSVLYTSTESITSISFHPYDDVIVFGTSNILCFMDWNNKCLLKTIKTNSREECVRFAKFLPTTGALITGVSTKYLEQNRFVRSYRIRNRSRQNSSSQESNDVIPEVSESTDDDDEMDDDGNEADNSSDESDEASVVLRLNFTPQRVSSENGEPATNTEDDSNRLNRPNIFNTIYELYLRLSCVTSVNFRKTLCRLQIWHSTDKDFPNLCNGKINVIGQLCRIRHESSCNISKDGSLIAYFEPNLESSSGTRHDFERDLILKVISLEKRNYLQCIYSRKYGQNAICVSLSPTNKYVLVGLATPKVVWQPTSQQLVGLISEIKERCKDDTAPDDSEATLSIIHHSKEITGSGISINAMVFHPQFGNGVVYGTNKGHIYQSHIFRSFNDEQTSKKF